MSGRRILRRAQWGTLLGGFLAAALAIVPVSPAFAAAVAVGAAWSAWNLRIMEGLLTAAIVPAGAPKNLKGVFLWSVAKLSVYVFAVWLLISAPIPLSGLGAGLTVMLIALVVAGLTTRPGEDPGRPPRGDDARA